MKFSEDTSNQLLRALNYPYWRPKESYVYDSGSILKLTSPCTGDLKRSIVDADGSRLSLEEYACRAGWPVAELESLRTPLLAHGSNASPVQLSLKFPGRGGYRTVIPVIRGTLKNYTVVYAAQFSKYGAIPATLAYEDGAHTDIFMCMVTEKQLQEFNLSEGLGDRYDLLRLPKGTATLVDDTLVASPAAYIATGGALFAGNHYWRVRNAGNARHEPDLTVDQRRIQQIVMELLNDPREVEEFIVDLLNDPNVRKERNRLLKDYSRSFEDSLPEAGQ